MKPFQDYEEIEWPGMVRVGKKYDTQISYVVASDPIYVTYCHYVTRRARRARSAKDTSVSSASTPVCFLSALHKFCTVFLDWLQHFESDGWVHSDNFNLKQAFPLSFLEISPIEY